MSIARVATVNQYPAFGASANGVLALRADGQAGHRQLTWFDRDGKALSTVGDPGGHEQLALSPDGTRLAYRGAPHSMHGDLWVMDLARGISTRFTSDGNRGGFPVWSPDGGRIAFRFRIGRHAEGIERRRRRLFRAALPGRGLPEQRSQQLVA